MLGRPDILRIAAVLALIVVIATAFFASGRRGPPPIDEGAPAAGSPASDDLSAELRRCGALGPADAENARCTAVWEENRRRFFGRPARPLPPTPPRIAPPATPAIEGAR